MLTTITRALVVAAPLALVGLTGSADAAQRYANCTALNKVYPHGVGRPGARDKTSGTSVTTFKRSSDLYKVNAGSDRDGDGIACEKA